MSSSSNKKKSKKVKKHIRIRIRKKTEKIEMKQKGFVESQRKQKGFRREKVVKKTVKAKPKKADKPKISLPDILQEQLEKPLTTSHCPNSVAAKDLYRVKKHPQNYMEINMITKSRMVDNFYITYDRRSFKYRNKRYSINEKRIYLLPSKSGFFMLTSFYKEGTGDPKNFKKSNIGITSKALTLLYNEKLYLYLLSTDEKKYNFFIAIFSVVLLILYGVGLYVIFK